MAEPSPWPTEIKLLGGRTLAVTFEDGARYELPAEYLRVESPSAEVQGHSPDQKVLVLGKRMVAITAVEPVGNYAVRLRFDDGHNTGIYTWEYLHLLGRDRTPIWDAYLKAVKERGLPSLS